MGLLLESASNGYRGHPSRPSPLEGPPILAYGAALLLAAVYAVSAIALAAVVFRRRDITA